MEKIEIDGVKYEVIEDLGYQHSRGVWAKEVMTENGTRVAFRASKTDKWELSKRARIVPRSSFVGQSGGE